MKQAASAYLFWFPIDFDDVHPVKIDIYKYKFIKLLLYL